MQWIRYKHPVDTRRRFNVDTTSYDVVRRCIDVETTSCVYKHSDILCIIFCIIMDPFRSLSCKNFSLKLSNQAEGTLCIMPSTDHTPFIPAIKFAS